jgi:hypothetical protein
VKGGTNQQLQENIHGIGNKERTYSKLNTKRKALEKKQSKRRPKQLKRKLQMSSNPSQEEQN